MIASLWSEFFTTPAFGAIVTLAGILLADWLRGRRDRSHAQLALDDLARTRQRQWALDLQDLLADFIAAESEYAYRFVVSPKNQLLLGDEAEHLRLSGRITVLKRRVGDQDLADLGNEAHALASDILKSTTAQEIADRAKTTLTVTEEHQAALTLSTGFLCRFLLEKTDVMKLVDVVVSVSFVPLALAGSVSSYPNEHNLRRHSGTLASPQRTSPDTDPLDPPRRHLMRTRKRATTRGCRSPTVPVPPWRSTSRSLVRVARSSELAVGMD